MSSVNAPLAAQNAWTSAAAMETRSMLPARGVCPPAEVACAKMNPFGPLMTTLKPDAKLRTDIEGLRAIAIRDDIVRGLTMGAVK